MVQEAEANTHLGTRTSENQTGNSGYKMAKEFGGAQPGLRRSAVQRDLGSAPSALTVGRSYGGKLLVN